MKHIQTINRNGKIRRYFASPTGFRITLPPIDDPRFHEVYSAALDRAEREMEQRKAKLASFKSAKEDAEVSSFYKRMAAKMRHRADELSVPCELSAADLRSISEEQQNICALTGIAFAFSKSERGRGRPFAPSPDRINSGDGYVKGNIRMVCQMANYARLDFSDEEFYSMCEAATRYFKRTHRERLSLNPVAKLPADASKIKGLKA